MKFDNLNYEELSKDELCEIEGGNKWKKLWNHFNDAMDVIGVYDAISDFYEGWNSVPTKC